MSPDQELLNLAGAESESKTLFDELAGLVPAERQAEYYRVIAHTRTLSPNDEMLRVLEAMGILALAHARNARRDRCRTQVFAEDSRKCCCLRPMKSRSEWQDTHPDSIHALRSCRRNWKQVWTRHA